MTTAPPPYGYPSAPPPFVPPLVPPARRKWGLVGAAFVLGALVAGVIVYFVASDSDASVSSDSVTLPDKVGSLQLAKDVKVPGDSSGRQAKNAAAQQKDSDANAARLSALHDGAGTAITNYASRDLQDMVTVTAIRTELDPLYVYEADPARLGLAVPTEQTKTFGDVTCLIRNPTTTSGGTPDAEQVIAEVCQRSSATLTVRLQGLYDSSPQKLADLTDQAFDAIS